MSQNRVYIMSVDIALPKHLRKKNLSDISQADLHPEYRYKLLESDLFAVFKGASVKVLKSRNMKIHSNTIMTRQELNDFILKE